MRIPSYRPLLAAIALFMALGGALTLATLSHAPTNVSATTRWVVEVNEQGFNPRQCNIVRNDEVVFKNVGHVAIRVYKPGFGGLPDDPDWTLAPGEESPALSFTSGINDVYKSGLGHSMTVFSPFVGNGTPGCFKEAPTPTPTPARTATPTATPPPPRPANCTWNGCAVAVALAADGE